VFKFDNVSRFQAAGTHFLISLAIFFILVILMVGWWYPGPFMVLIGIAGLQIVIYIDLVLGPLLTLVVFNPQKRKKLIILDLSVIATIQLIALVYGVYVVFNEKPLVQALGDDTLYILAKADFKAANIEMSPLRSLPGRYPKIIFIDMPVEADERFQLKMDSFHKYQAEYSFRTDLYRSYESFSQEKLEKRLRYYKYDDSADCYWVKMETAHEILEGCFHLKKGVVKYKKMQ